MRLPLAIALVLLAGAAGASGRTDVIVLGNGDRITGEIKKLDRGRLEVKTDHAGTIVDAGLKRELVKDFFAGFNGYHTLDTAPPNPAAAHGDVGVTLSIGWSY